MTTPLPASWSWSKTTAKTVQCTLILMSEWRVKLPEYLMADEPS